MAARSTVRVVYVVSQAYAVEQGAERELPCGQPFDDAHPSATAPTSPDHALRRGVDDRLNVGPCTIPAYIHRRMLLLRCM